MFIEELLLDLTIRLKKYDKKLELSTFLRSNSPGQNTDIILQITAADLKSADTFYTDSNGIFIEERTRRGKIS